MYKYIIFDFDGTIVDSMGVMLDIAEQLSEKYGISHITREDAQELGSLSMKNKLKKVGVPLYKVPVLMRDVLEKYRNSVDKLVMFEGVREAIRLLGEQYTLGIISSNSVPNIEKFLENNDIKEFKSVYSSKGLFGKDYTINKFKKTENIRDTDLIYIGDELRDITACKKAGVKVAAVTWGYDSEKLLSEGGPDYLIREPMELVKVLHC